MDFQAACTFRTQWFSNKKRKKKKPEESAACVLLSAYSADVRRRRLKAACVFGAGYALSSTAFLFIK